MLYNYVTEEILKGFVPELTRYLWSGESNYDKQKQAAEQIVVSDFINRGFKIVALRPDLYLRNSTDGLNANTDGVSYEDNISRMRLAYNVISYSGTCSLVLQGSNDEAVWDTITTISITATGIKSASFVSAYKYYRVNATVGTSLAFKAWLAETNFDLWFIYKWLELIMVNARREENDRFDLAGAYFRAEYEKLWDTASIYKDENQDGVVSDDDKELLGNVRFGR